jgi:hypothetical protein
VLASRNISAPAFIAANGEVALACRAPMAIRSASSTSIRS